MGKTNRMKKYGINIYMLCKNWHSTVNFDLPNFQRWSPKK